MADILTTARNFMARDARSQSVYCALVLVPCGAGELGLSACASVDEVAEGEGI